MLQAAFPSKSLNSRSLPYFLIYPPLRRHCLALSSTGQQHYAGHRDNATHILIKKVQGDGFEGLPLSAIISPFSYSLTDTQIQTNRKVELSVMVISKFVHLRQKWIIADDAQRIEPDIHLPGGEADSINSYQFEDLIPFGTSNPKQEIPDDLRVAYTEFKRLYEALGCY